MRTSFTIGDNTNHTILSSAHATRYCTVWSTVSTDGACAGESLAPKCRFHLSISDRRLNSTLSPH